MTATATPAARGGVGRAVLWVVIVVAALLVIGALSVRDEDPEPYDPDSVAPTGTRATVELLESFGADVRVPERFSIDDVAPGAVLVLFQDATDQEQTGVIEAWIERGGTLLVTDPFSSFSPPLEMATDQLGGPPPSPVIEQGRCTLRALADVEQISPHLEDGPASFLSPTFAVADEDASCFGDRDHAFVVVTASGEGRTIALADGTVFQNGALGTVDNAALVTSLLAPAPGSSVVILEPSALGSEAIAGDAAIGSIDRIVGAALPFLVLQALVAIVVLALAQGRRLGRPVAEPQPVQIAGSELVVAMGDLLRQAGSPDTAAALLRADLRRELCLRIGLPPDTPLDVLVATVDARTGLGRDRIGAVVADHPVPGERELVELCRAIDSIREEILHVPTA